uniref:Uncharacterized protein n=1 Tax=Arundo donax TaxID=35708 RepID=A0A0A9CWL2_ARUDO
MRFVAASLRSLFDGSFFVFLRGVNEGSMASWVAALLPSLCRRKF